MFASKGTLPPVDHRWTSEFEGYQVVMASCPAVFKFIDTYSATDEGKSASINHIRRELARVRPDGVRQEIVLRVQLAMVVMDVGEMIAKATYNLEGDARLVGLFLASYCVDWVVGGTPKPQPPTESAKPPPDSFNIFNQPDSFGAFLFVPFERSSTRLATCTRRCGRSWL